MKLLAAADIHGAQFRMNIILKNIERYSPDIVIICGDITQFGPGELAKNFLNQIPVETFAVTGNIDSEDVKKGIDESNAKNLEMKKIVKKDISFVGANGVDQKQLRFIKDKEMIDKKSVLISHTPPHGIQDKIFMGSHGGNKELRNIIEEYEPRLVLCGHIHEDPGYTKHKNTVVINCSIGKKGEGSLIEINDDISVKML